MGNKNHGGQSSVRSDDPETQNAGFGQEPQWIPRAARSSSAHTGGLDRELATCSSLYLEQLLSLAPIVSVAASALRRQS